LNGCARLTSPRTLSSAGCSTAQASFAKIGYELEPVDKKVREPFLAQTRQALGEGAFRAAQAEGEAIDPNAALAEARSYLREMPR
jgi:hypothetical protein